jgi:hypothetical protein
MYLSELPDSMILKCIEMLFAKTRILKSRITDVNKIENLIININNTLQNSALVRRYLSELQTTINTQLLKCQEELLHLEVNTKYTLDEITKVYPVNLNSKSSTDINDNNNSNVKDDSKSNTNINDYFDTDVDTYTDVDTDVDANTDICTDNLKTIIKLPDKQKPSTSNLFIGVKYNNKKSKKEIEKINKYDKEITDYVHKNTALIDRVMVRNLLNKCYPTHLTFFNGIEIKCPVKHPFTLKFLKYRTYLVHSQNSEIPNLINLTYQNKNKRQVLLTEQLVNELIEKAI